MRRVIAFVICCLIGGVQAQSELDPYIEIDKTNQVIELEAEFEACGGKASFRAQDGAMVTFNVDDSPTVRFVVKKYGPGNIKLHMIQQSEWNIGGQMRPGLMIQPGIDLLNSVSVAELKARGIKSVVYKTDYPMATASNVAPAAATSAQGGATTQQANCCCFTMCDKKRACGCSTGPACFWDQAMAAA
jgi:hypothetical protein